VLCDGRSPIDPRLIESKNSHHAGIFPVGIGDDIDFARLEMVAAWNYGFTTYLDNEANITSSIERLLCKLSQPIMKDVRLEFGRADLHDILPSKYPAAYAGACFHLTGRYVNPATSAFSVAGQSVSGYAGFDFNLDFSRSTETNKFAEHMWAKEKIDELEWETDIYGETMDLREQLIALSLQYNIRCRYTAYVADYETEYSNVTDDRHDMTIIPSSYVISSYPNPFNPSTTIRFYIAPEDVGLVKFIKIYNALGQLVAVLDISSFAAGLHSVRFDGRDYFGQPLPSGQYFVRLEIGERMSTMKITLAR
ncbi:T9SS type A sorting domain-containing protein, partial [candidate division KSB1 bacterium]|nr:T9SS type A sorting domain-containing protein [candidate division KSB1 bacterium]